jgi:glycosyltransferase involved in cell wall biosynthesis
MTAGITVLILTLNEEKNLPGCMASADFADNVVVLDSGSTDATVQVAGELGARVAHRRLDNWAAHQNWALDNLVADAPWVLMLDADERVSPELAKSLTSAAKSRAPHDAYYIRRRDWFMGRPIERVQATPRLIRFFRPRRIRFARFVNPFAEVHGSIGDLSEIIEHYPFSKGLDHWIRRHLEYARLEARERADTQAGGIQPSLIRAFFSPDLATRRKHQKCLCAHLPAWPVLHCAYFFLARRGFLDGAPGIAYAVLRSFYEYWIVLFSRRQR